MSEKFQLVLDVAQKAQVAHKLFSLETNKNIPGSYSSCVFFQNLFGKMADVLEKIKK